MSPKVLVVIDSLTLGGAERVLATLAGAAAPAGIELDIVSLAPPAGDRAVLLPVLEQAGLHPRFLSIGRVSDPRSLPRLARCIARSGCDVVHAHLEASAMLAPAAAALSRRPTVCTFHHVPGPLGGRRALRERAAVASANRGRRVVFVSHASRRGFAARYGEGARWTVVRNGVDLDRFRPSAAPLPAELGGGGAPTAVLVGAMRPGKGHVFALDAWAKVRAAVPDARLLFVGSGELEPALRATADASGLGDAVVFAGLRADVDAIVAAADLVLLPSESEALPTVLMEAAACGRPVVATRVGGCPEVVVDGETGVLVALGDTGAFVDAITALLGDRDERDAMGIAARRHAEHHFGSHDWAMRLREVYDDALRRPDRGRA
jgi:glycosyltransferase involved in cell wall biosynthesis